jgi:hypothetical protein
VVGFEVSEACCEGAAVVVAGCSSSRMLSSAILLAAPGCVSRGDRDGAEAEVAAGGLVPLGLVLTPKVSPSLAVSRRLLLVSASSFPDCLLCSVKRRSAAIRSSRDADCILFGLSMSVMNPERRREARLFGGCRPEASAPSASRGGGRGASAEARLWLLSPSCSLAGRRSIRLFKISFGVQHESYRDYLP